MFFKFPEILIFIGIILLIIAIIIGIIAYRSEDDEDDIDATIIEEANEKVISEHQNIDELKDNVPISSEEDLAEEQIQIEEANIPVEEIKPIEIEEQELQEEVPMVDPIPIEEISTEQEEVEEPKEEQNEETKIELEPLVETPVQPFDNDLSDIHEENFIDSEEIVETPTEELIETPEKADDDYVPYEYEYNPELEATRPIYGGTRPLENIDLHFDEEKHEVYTNYIKSEETKKENQDDDIELL